MRIVQGEGIACGVCGAVPAVIYCDGCEIPLCVRCRDFDLWGYGCGHVDTKVFCPTCLRDVRTNPYGAWHGGG
ncbi:MAG TPA: hypothetical protein PK836_03385 [Syntrophales bacterium]|nr:hypothetical protein [Syntrophales bacterium]HOM06595.1 hypothetical protein [Syntrophales bacterium]HON99622.1 hypothetical protein [Syntrophales bacterium]HPC00707.1 hypothetical protein [Syntrophales bacterium]HPQ06143.1 hypothetical protein [Syntrophales bacterium]